MNYTENYHLPQWVETDRVLMKDFNDAMSSIEDGLTGVERKQTAFDNLSRDAYRQEVQQRVHHGPGGSLDTMWVNALASREDAGDSRWWGGEYGLELGKGKLPTEAGILPTAVEKAAVSWAPTYVEYSLRAEAEFTSDGFGNMETLSCWFQMNDWYTSKEFPFVITLTRTDTDQIVAQSETLLSDSTCRAKAYTVNFPLEEGVPYRVAFELPDQATFYGFAGFCINSESRKDIPLGMTLTDRAVTETLVKNVPRPSAYYQGARCMVRWAGDGSVKLRVNGQTLPVVRTREAINAKGQPCKETELALAALPEGDFQLEMTMQADAGKFSVYDYGLIWQ